MIKSRTSTRNMISYSTPKKQECPARRRSMKRKQIYLTDEQDEGLATLALMKGVSQADLVREAVSRYLAGAKTAPTDDDPLLSLAGIAGGTHADASLNHDRYLYGRPRPRRKSRPDDKAHCQEAGGGDARHLR